MPKITSIEQQKHNKTRASIFVDGEYAFSLTADLCAVYGLKVGAEVNVLPLKEMAREDEFETALQKAYRHLATTGKTEKQMRDFLLGKEYSTEAVERVLDRLKELNFINDEEYAKNFAESNNSIGKRAIAYKLKQKGIDEKQISIVLDSIDDDAVTDSAIQLAEKQVKHYYKCSIFEKKQKLSAYLARRGFDWDTVSTAVEKAVGEESEDNI